MNFDNIFRVQAGTNVQEMAKDRHLLSFLGWSIDAEATSHKILKKADRSTTSKVIYSPLEIEEYLLISPLCPMLEQEGTVVSTYRAVTTVRSQETAKKNSPVLYVNSTGEVMISNNAIFFQISRITGNSKRKKLILFS